MPFSTPTAHNPKQPEEELAELINVTGKLRMLSHQAVMCAALEEVGDEDGAFKAKRDLALQEFERIANLITEPSTQSGLNPITVDLLTSGKVVSPEQKKYLLEFLERSKAMQGTWSAKTATHLGAFVSTTLLSALNALIENIKGVLDQNIIKKRNEHAPLLHATTSSLEGIGRLAKSLTIVSMNASLEAQRAGNHGAAFGEIAREMRTLAGQSTKQAQKLSEDLVRFQEAQTTATGRPS